MIKFGIVKYINSVHIRMALAGLCSVIGGTPAELADLFERGELDVTFIPSVEYLSDDRGWKLVRGVSISSAGPTNSVFLALKTAPNEVRTLAPSQESRTSNFMAMKILERKFGVVPKLLPSGAKTADAEVVIGDLALRQAGSTDARWLDIGEEWWNLTGLPIVYAVCVARTAELAKWASDIFDERLPRDSVSLRQTLKECGKSEYFDYINGLDYKLDEPHLRSLSVIAEMIRETRSADKRNIAPSEPATLGAQLCHAR